ncbi:MAG: hypothetical protein AB7S38_11470 [Vulcanimicrobiota bacterium]
MKVQSLNRQEAVHRLQAEEVRLLGDNRPNDAAEVLKARKLISDAPGDTLWDAYSQAGDKAEKSQRLSDTLVPRFDYYGEAKLDLRPPLALLGVGMAGTALANYVRTGDLGTSLLVGLIPAGVGVLAGLVNLFTTEEGGRDTSRVSTATIATTSIAAAATGNWVAPVIAGTVTMGALVAATRVSGQAAQKQMAIQAAITNNRELFKTPLNPSQVLGTKISKQEVVQTLSRLESQAITENQFEDAMKIRKDLATVATLGGQNFHEMFVECQAHGGDRAKLLNNYAEAILDDARKRTEIEDLVKGNPKPGELLVGDELVDVVDQQVPVYR